METLALFLADVPPESPNRYAFLFDANTDEPSSSSTSACDFECNTIDAIVLCGSAALDTVAAAARLWHIIKKRTSRQVPLLVSGGVGHSTPILYSVIATQIAELDERKCSDKNRFSDRPPVPRLLVAKTAHMLRDIAAGTPESSILAMLLTFELGVDSECVFTEEESTNCGANAEKSTPILLSLLTSTLRARASNRTRNGNGVEKDDEKTTTSAMIATTKPLATVALFQDPTMMRRSRLSFEKHTPKFNDVPTFNFLSISSPFCVPPRSHPPYDQMRYVSLLVGEIPRLDVKNKDGYGPAGKNFIGPCEIPNEVMLSYEGLAAKAEQEDNLRKIRSGGK